MVDGDLGWQMHTVCDWLNEANSIADEMASDDIKVGVVEESDLFGDAS
jgi:hypothetical protein